MKRARWILLLFFLLIAGLIAIADEAPKDKTLLSQAQEAVAAGKWDEAVIAMESLRKQFPQSTVLPDGMVLLYQSCYMLKNKEKYGAVGKEITTRWPKSDYVWQVVLFTCKQKAKLSAKEAIAALDQAMNQDMLSADGRAKAQKMRFTLEQQAKSQQFLNEGLEKIKQLTPPVERAALVDAAKAAEQIYPTLFTAARGDEAKEIFNKMDGLLAEGGNPDGHLLVNRRAYLTALKTADAKRYAEEAIATVTAIKTAKLPEEVQLIVELAVQCYPDLLRNKPYEEAKALHDAIQEAFKRIKCDPATVKYETNAWYGILAYTRQDKLVEEMAVVIARLKNAKSADEAIFKPESTTALYTTCFQKRNPEMAKEFYDRVQAFYKRFEMKEDAITDEVQYRLTELIFFMDTDRKRYLDEAVATLLDLDEKITVYNQMVQMNNITIWRNLYLDLLQAGQAEGATKHFERLQAAYLRTEADVKLVRSMHLNAYLNGLGSYNPNTFLNTYLPMIIKAKKDATVEDAGVLVDVSRFAYTYLLRNGRAEEAKGIHTQLLSVIKQLNAGKLLETAYTRYFTGFAQSAPQNLLPEVLPFIEILAKATTADDMLQCAPAICAAYALLNRTGHFEDACSAHEKMKAQLAKFNLADAATQDEKLYRVSLTAKEWEIMLQSCKEAIAKKDAATAKKWLAELTAYAPDAAQTTQAKKLWKESGLEK